MKINAAAPQTAINSLPAKPKKASAAPQQHATPAATVSFSSAAQKLAQNAARAATAEAGGH